MLGMFVKQRGDHGCPCILIEKTGHLRLGSFACYVLLYINFSVEIILFWFIVQYIAVDPWKRKRERGDSVMRKMSNREEGGEKGREERLEDRNGESRQREKKIFTYCILITLFGNPNKDNDLNCITKTFFWLLLLSSFIHLSCFSFDLRCIISSTCTHLWALEECVLISIIYLYYSNIENKKNSA